MAYRLRRKDVSVRHGICRIAQEQIDAAIALLDAVDAGADVGVDAVHDLRKRCKKLRGLVRLVRPAFGDYARENAAFRDIARAISGPRDATVMQGTYDLLMQEFAGQVDRQALGSIRLRFTTELKAKVDDGEVARNLAETRKHLLEAQERVGSWDITDDGWSAVSGGLRKTYARARDAAAQARSSPDGESFHELRKRIKYHWYHCRLLEEIWPDMMIMRKQTAMQLAEILGQHHDLQVFADRLRAEPLVFGKPHDVELAIGLARARQERIESEAWPMVDRLLAETPKALGEHFGALWKVWRKGA